MPTISNALEKETFKFPRTPIFIFFDACHKTPHASSEQQDCAGIATTYSKKNGDDVTGAIWVANTSRSRVCRWEMAPKWGTTDWGKVMKMIEKLRNDQIDFLHSDFHQYVHNRWRFLAKHIYLKNLLKSLSRHLSALLKSDQLASINCTKLQFTVSTLKSNADFGH